MLQAVKVRLRKPTRVFVFLARDITLARGDNVIVRSDRGLECGTCVVEPEDCPDEMSKRYTMSVVRKMTQHDENTYRQIALDEALAQNLCRQKIRDRSLPMNLVDVEYTFDHHKVIFYFTAEDRVDFRELVRRLSGQFKVRVELLQQELTKLVILAKVEIQLLVVAVVQVVLAVQMTERLVQLQLQLLAVLEALVELL